MNMHLKRYLSENRGSQAAIARAIGVTPPYIWQIANGMRKIPADHVIAIESATDHKVSRHDLRPDIYPREAWCRCPACERERNDKGEVAA